MSEELIIFNNVTKQFGKVKALIEVNFTIKEREIFGLLGVNGAGKTTLLRCLLRLLRASSGRITLKGKEITDEDVLEKFGFLPENFSPPRNLKGAEFLQILSWVRGKKGSMVDELLETVGLTEHKDKYIRNYSRGMIQRLGIATSLLKAPDIIILDEPTLGLDPIGQRDILSILTRLNQQGKTIFFSSHILSQIQRVCSRIGILHLGRIKFTGEVNELTARHQVNSLEEAFLREIGG